MSVRVDVTIVTSLRRHDTRHNDIQLNDTISSAIMLSVIYTECSYAEVRYAVSWRRHYKLSGGKWNSTLKKCKQLFEYQHLLLLRDIWWSKF